MQPGATRCACPRFVPVGLLTPILPLWTIWRMSLALSHPLHQQSLRFVQGKMHRDSVLKKQLRIVNDLLYPEKKALREKVMAWKNMGGVINSRTQDQQDELQSNKFMLRMERATKKRAEAFNIAVAEQKKRLALNTISSTPEAGASRQNHQTTQHTQALAFFAADTPIPPGATICSIPRRPGAPSALLPH